MNSANELSSIKSALDNAETHIRSGRNYREIINLLTPLLDILRRSEHTHFLMTALLDLGIGYCELGLLTKARISLEEGLNLARTSENQALLSSFLHELSLVAFQDRRLLESLSLGSEALSLGLAADDDVGNTAMHMAVLYQMLGQFKEAKEILQAVRSNCERNFDIQLLARILNEMGLVEFELGNYQMGVKSFLDSVRYKNSLGDDHGIRKSITNLQACFMRFPAAMTDPEVKRIIDRIT